MASRWDRRLRILLSCLLRDLSGRLLGCLCSCRIGRCLLGRGHKHKAHSRKNNEGGGSHQNVNLICIDTVLICEAPVAYPKVFAFTVVPMLVIEG